MTGSDNSRSNEPRSLPPIGMRGGGSQPGMPPAAKAKPKDTAQTVRRIWQYMQRYRKALLGILAATLGATLLSLIAPYLIGHAIDSYLVPGQYEGLLKLCLGLAAAYAGTAAFTWLQQHLVVRAAQHTVRDMRSDAFARLQRLPLRYFDSKTNGELMSRTTNDIENVSGTLNQSVTQIISSVIMLTGSLAIMLWLNIWLTLLSLVMIPLVMLFTKKVASYTRRFFSSQQKSLGELNGFIEETVSGQKVVQVYRREAIAADRFDEINRKLTADSIKAQIYSGTIGPFMNVFNNFSFALIAAIGGWMAYRDLTTVGVIVSFLNYSKQFQRPLNELANQFNMLQSAVAGAERVFEMIDEPSEYENDGKRMPKDMAGEVRFENVSFGYKQDIPVLSDVSLTATPGQTIALVGPTGAGKTTVINLLTRFYEVDGGAITLDGIDIRELGKDHLRSRLGIVLQDAYVFASTIRENIRYGRLEASDAEIEAAAKLANAHSFIAKLPQGYDTPLAAGGGNLSQGQRQLLTIARAVLADPAVLILDEATSSIDTRTEMHIQTAMRELMKGRTSFVIAHRLSTIREADQILVVKDGGISERGTHEELLALRGFYYELYTSQFKRSG
ncbi:ABC transporter ATP-binding protein [Paenibacillus sp. NPDC058071]|uniref:ABC transporter ATP-binding protein n=1 Tax=Paenibacillus sp. NPDC058071 TaxID=3346326 RepID=UPI0036D814AB